jgi:hypothetical protein
MTVWDVRNVERDGSNGGGSDAKDGSDDDEREFEGG